VGDGWGGVEGAVCEEDPQWEKDEEGGGCATFRLVIFCVLLLSMELSSKTP
jgi:hypothetical protein